MPEANVARWSRMLRGDLPTPLYHQIFLVLRDRIVAGELPHGAQLPTEHELAEAFEVSRITAKRALDELAAEGLVARRRGRGTHVIHRSQIKPQPAPLVGLIENLEILAEHTDVRLLGFERRVPPAAIRELFDSGPDAGLAHTIRVRSRDGIPFGHYESWTRTEHPAFDAASLATTSRIRLFERCGIRLAQVEQVLSAAPADAAIASALEIPEGTALLTLERRSFDPEGALVDWLLIHYHPERFQYRMTLSPDDAALAPGHA
jgi:GntR family transcriptional regulator